MGEKKKRRVFNANFQEMRKLAAIVATGPFDNHDETACTTGDAAADGDACSKKEETAAQTTADDPASTSGGDRVSSKKEIPDQAAGGDPARSKEEGVVDEAAGGDAASSKKADQVYTASSGETQKNEPVTNPQSVSQEQAAKIESSSSDEEYGSEESGEDDDDDDNITSDEASVTDDDVTRMVDWLMEVESEAAEAQEALEEESLNKVAQEVRAELAEKHSGAELELAVNSEMKAYIASWREHLSELEDESSKLQERVENAGVSLSDLYKTMEKQAPDGCVTESWRKRTHWAGTEASKDVVQVVQSAEEDLERQRPVMRRRGKLIEEGASGFLESKRITSMDDKNTVAGWNLLDELAEPRRCAEETQNLFRTKAWAAVYSASTPEQASRLGLRFPGVNKVEQIADIDEKVGLEATALAEESAFGLTERQKRRLKRVCEKDDVQEMYKKPGRRRDIDIDDEAPSAGEESPIVQDTVAKATSAADPGCDMDTNISAEHVQAEKANESSDDANSQNETEGGKDHPEDQANVRRPEENKNSEDHPGLVRKEELPKAKQAKAVPELIILSDDDMDDIPSAECASNKQSAKTNIEKEDLDDTTSPLKARKRIGEPAATPGKKRRKLVVDDCSDEEYQPPEASGRKDKKSDAPAAEGPTVQSAKMKEKCLSGTEDGVCEVSSGDEREATSLKTASALVEVSCTVCSKSLACRDVVAHPLLPVIVCRSCKEMYEGASFTKDEDGSDNECRWCAEGGDLLCCDICARAICVNCIKRNIGPGIAEAIEVSDCWNCFICDPSPLKKLSRLLEAAEQGKVAEPSGGKKEPYSASRKRKNIRKVLADDQLDEKTKKMLEIEKERRERVKKWYEAAGKGKTRFEASRRRASHPDESVHICEGDCKALGCVINITDRETDEPLIRIPPSISTCLKPHQLAGVRFLWENVVESVSKVKSGAKGLGCILAHCMGLGKTLQVIAFLYAAMRAVGFRTALIVVPVNVLHNWKRELTKWQPREVPALPVYMLDDVLRNHASRASHLSKWKEKGGVMLIGYTAFRNLCIGKSVSDKDTRTVIRECLQNPGPDLLVCDEAHTIKNKKADITQELQQVKTLRRIAMTGSPLQNNLMEYYCMVNFVREGFLGGVSDFRNRFQNPIANGQHADSTAADVKKMKQCSHVLHARLEGFVQRRDTSVLKYEIPPKCVWVISVRLSALQKELYRKYLSYCGSRQTLLFENYHSLAKIWNHPDVLWLAKEQKNAEQFVVDSDKEDEAEEPGVPKRQGESPPEGNYDWCQDVLSTAERHVLENGSKLLLVLRLLGMSASQKDKMLIFSQSLNTLDLLESFMEKTPRSNGYGCWSRGREWYRLDGSTAGMKRQQLTEKFNDPDNDDVKCVLISTRAGSLGINLTGASRVVVIDGSWNPTHDIQALFRAWRLGQTKPVYAYRLLAYGTLEEKIYHRQLAKEGMAARVLDAHQVGRHLNADDLDLLYTFDDDDDVPEDAAEAEAESSTRARKSKHKAFCMPSDAPPRDELMAMLLLDYRPRLIANYHEHEPLLEDLEDEKLSTEEKLQAWESFRKEHEQPQDQTPPAAPAPRPQPQPQPQQGGAPAPCDPDYHAQVLNSLSLPVSEVVTCGKCHQKIGWQGLKR